jgi:hypothetical protein
VLAVYKAVYNVTCVTGVTGVTAGDVLARKARKHVNAGARFGFGVQVVGGSNPLAPTNLLTLLQRLSQDRLQGRSRSIQAWGRFWGRSGRGATNSPGSTPGLSDSLIAPRWPTGVAERGRGSPGAGRATTLTHPRRDPNQGGGSIPPRRSNPSARNPM